MKTKQFIGPFLNNQLLTLDELGNNINVIQIGIERPHSIPISEEGTQKIILSINDKDYCLGESDLLEFENVWLNRLNIRVKDGNNPYLIITIAYE